MENNLAVLIVGEQNSGKSTTIKYFEQFNDENHHEKDRTRIGWKRLQFFLDKLDALICLVYCVPSSPTESHKSLENKLKEHGFRENTPEMLIIAEQLNGEQYQSTIDFLDEKNYKVVEFIIDNKNSGTIWSRWSDSKKDYILTERAKAISNEFIAHIREKIQ